MAIGRGLCAPRRHPGRSAGRRWRAAALWVPSTSLPASQTQGMGGQEGGSGGRERGEGCGGGGGGRDSSTVQEWKLLHGWGLGASGLGDPPGRHKEPPDVRVQERGCPRAPQAPADVCTGAEAGAWTWGLVCTRPRPAGRLGRRGACRWGPASDPGAGGSAVPRCIGPLAGLPVVRASGPRGASREALGSPRPRPDR